MNPCRQLGPGPTRWEEILQLQVLSAGGLRELQGKGWVLFLKAGPQEGPTFQSKPYTILLPGRTVWHSEALRGKSKSSRAERLKELIHRIPNLSLTPQHGSTSPAGCGLKTKIKPQREETPHGSAQALQAMWKQRAGGAKGCFFLPFNPLEPPE